MLPYSKLNNNKWLKRITFELICFIVVSALSFGLCYSYFQAEIKVSGVAITATVNLEYRQTADGTASDIIYATLDGVTTIAINDVENCEIIPGQIMKIKGYVVNTSTIEVYIMGKLTLQVLDKNGNVKFTDTIWYNISNGDTCSTKLTIGASSLPVGANQELSLPYTFDGEKYVNDDVINSITFELYAHQKDYLNLSDDFNDFTSIGSYTKEQVYAGHCITGLSL